MDIPYSTYSGGGGGVFFEFRQGALQCVCVWGGGGGLSLDLQLSSAHWFALAL